MVFEGDVVLVRAAVAFLISLEGKLLGEASPAGVREVISQGVSVSEDEWMKALRNAWKP